jgi:hypothetical protein
LLAGWVRRRGLLAGWVRRRGILWRRATLVWLGLRLGL